MDLAVYISELLNQQGTVTVPGLGTFNQVRVASYYNEAEGKFYPPHYQASFVAQLQSTDMALAQYISSKNNVSSGSARFFVNKYVADLLQQIEAQEVAINHLGYLYKQDGEIKFRPSTNGAVVSAAYGFSAVNLRPEQEPVKQPAPVQPVAAPAPAIPEPVRAQPKTPEAPQPIPVTTATPVISAPQNAVPAAPANRPEAVKAEVPAPQIPPQTETLAPATPAAKLTPPNTSRWVVMVMIAAIILVGGIAMYRTLLDEKNNEQAANEPHSVTTAAPATVAADTVIINKAPVVADTVVSIPPVTDSVTQQSTPQVQTQNLPPAETTSQPAASNAVTPVLPALINDKNYKFTLLGGAFGTKEQANTVVNQYKAKGVNAAVLINPPSKMYKVTLGYFKTFAEGQKAKIDLVAAKQLQSAKLYVETIRKNPTK